MSSSPQTSRSSVSNSCYVVAGVLCCLTIIGIPFGLQSFKLAGLALAPFGRRVVESKDLSYQPVSN